ncbi:MAG: aldehyde ferredoxin oxidoreductase family protein [Candidatus Latescibacterota bacterium]
MTGGYVGKLLFVDLSDGTIKEEALDEGLCRDFLGGYGIGAKILYDRMKPGVDPLGPENILGFMTGPLTGTPALIGSRYVVVAKSPLTGGWGDANSGGYFGPALKSSGYDGVFFTRQSKSPVYLFIDEGRAQLKDASHLWGKDVVETDDLLTAELGQDTQCAYIGPSGEQLSLISCILNDKGRAAGRSGLGAVMGSKKLKAIAVKGSLPIPVADEKQAKALRKQYGDALKKNAFAQILSKHGTAGITAGSAASGDSPVKNWAGSGTKDFPTASKISDDAVIAYQEKKYGCWHCPIACGGHVNVRKGPFAVTNAHKPEYETLCMFGALALNDNIEAITKVNDICNRAGFDTISAGSAVSFAIECYENGVLTQEDTGGLELTWGNAEAIVALVGQIARREGLGALLADGVQQAALRIGKGSEQYAVHVGGQEVPAHDPKLSPGLGMVYLLDATPARHTQGWGPGEGGMDIGEHDYLDYTGRGEDQNKAVNSTHLINAAGLCLFGHMSMDGRSIPEFLTAIIGRPYTMAECLEIGERIATIRHLFNLREGLNPLDRFANSRVAGDPPLKEGPLKGVTLDMDRMVGDYLKVMDWDPKTTMPSTKKLAALGLRA